MGGYHKKCFSAYTIWIILAYAAAFMPGIVLVALQPVSSGGMGLHFRFLFRAGRLRHGGVQAVSVRDAAPGEEREKGQGFF